MITGAASGIGAGTARLFHEEGAFVVLADMQEGPGAALARNLGDRARFIRADVTNEADISAAVDLAVAQFGSLDVMVNNAGVVGAVGPLKDTPLDDWNRTIAILLTGVFLGVKHAARIMVPRRRGAILSVASTAGVMGGLGPHAYTAAKHGVVGLTKSAASELAQYGIRVNAVAPGNTVTAMTSSLLTGDPAGHAEAAERIAAGAPLGIAGTPEDPAYAMLYLASDEACYVTGHTLVVDSGQTTGGTVPAFHNGAVGLISAPTVTWSPLRSFRMRLDPRLDALLSRQEIYDQCCRYLRAQDRLMPTLHRSVFWDDATTDYGFYRGGPDGFVDFAQNALKDHLSNHHMMGQALIEVEGDVGFGEIYFQAFHRIVEKGAEKDLIISGRYVDRYQRREGVWKIAHRSELVDWARTEPAADEWLKATPDVLVGYRGERDLSNQRERLRTL